MQFRSFDAGVLVLGACPGFEAAWESARPVYFTFDVTNGAEDQGPTPVTVLTNSTLTQSHLNRECFLRRSQKLSPS